MTAHMISIAIDGPGGAGKSTIARAAAKELGYIYVDTGALYRAIGLFMLRKGINPAIAAQVEAELPQVRVSLQFVQGEQHVFLGEEDVSEAIRTPKASMAASAVSAIPAVRAFLFDLQRGMAEKNNVIMDGRDIGTVVLPNAKIKLFLTASTEERAHRRFEELKNKGQEVDYNEVLTELKQRDYNDTNRSIAPLVPAQDAVLVDTTGGTLEESTARVLGLIHTLL